MKTLSVSLCASVWLYLCVHILVHIYIYIYNEGKRKRGKCCERISGVKKWESVGFPNARDRVGEGFARTCVFNMISQSANSARAIQMMCHHSVVLSVGSLITGRAKSVLTHDQPVNQSNH